MNDAIQKVIDRLTIDDVAHLNSTIKVDDRFLATPPDELGIRIQLRTQFDRWDMDELVGPDDEIVCRYRFAYDLGLRMLEIEHEEDAADGDSIIAVVEAKMYAQYVEHHDGDREDLDPDVLDEFGRTNALYHVWPYWREYVQSALSRLRLPPLTIPMFRLPEQNWRQTTGEREDE